DVVVYDLAVTIVSFVVLGWHVNQIVMLWTHVFRLSESEIFVKSVFEFFEVPSTTEMPFPENGSGISFLFHEFGESHFGGVDAHFRPGRERPVNAEPIGIATGQQRGAGSRTDRLSDMKIAECAS